MFEINLRQNLPPDHAALELCLNNMTLNAIEYMKSGAPSLCQSVHQNHTQKLLKGLNHNRIDQVSFINELSKQEIPAVCDEIEELVAWLQQTMDNAAFKSMITEHENAVTQWDAKQNRWQRLLESCDH